MTDGYDETNKSPAEDWAMADPDFHLKEKLKADNAEIPAASLYAPPDSFEENFEPNPNSEAIQPETENRTAAAPKVVINDNWKMPEPVFRSSEGKTIKKPENKNTNPDLPAVQPEISDKAEFSADIVQPDVSEEFEAGKLKSELKNKKSAEKKNEKNPKLFLLFGGLFLLLTFAAVFVIGIYFLFFQN